MSNKGIVYLVGAGPGEPGLLTQRGAELLRQAEVVICDDPANAGLMRLASAEAELILAGELEWGQCQTMPAKELSKVMVKKAREKKRVVRLKPGDPYVLGDGGKDAEILAKAGICFEVVPGITLPEAAAHYSGIPLMHPDFPGILTMINSDQDSVKKDTPALWNALANMEGTLAVLGGCRNLPQIAEKLLAHGKPSATPLAIIQSGATSVQQTVVGTLGSLASLVEQIQGESPVLAVVGEVVRLSGKLNWFAKRPLLGQRIVNTRAQEQAHSLSGPLAAQGAHVLEIPVIKIGPPKKKEALKEVLSGLNAYDWVVFSSPNGVSAFFELFWKVHKDLRDIGGVRIAAVGSATAARINELHLEVDAMPEEFVGEKIAEAIAQQQSLENLRILLLRAEKANPVLPKLLEDLGAIVDDVPCYQTMAEKTGATATAADLMEHGADWLTFTSGSTVECFNDRFNLPKLVQKHPGIKLASIGPETSKAITALGLTVAVEADPHTIEGLIHGITGHKPTHP